MPKQEEIKEQKVSMFDPVVNSYREIPVSLARKLIESSKEVEKKIGKEKKDE
jgi:hypothetical protein